MNPQTSEFGRQGPMSYEGLKRNDCLFMGLRWSRCPMQSRVTVEPFYPIVPQKPKITLM